MFNIITGNYEPTEGSIKFHGQKIDGIKPIKLFIEELQEHFKILDYLNL